VDKLDVRFNGYGLRLFVTTERFNTHNAASRKNFVGSASDRRDMPSLKCDLQECWENPKKGSPHQALRYLIRLEFLERWKSQLREYLMWYTRCGFAELKVLEQDEETRVQASLFFCLCFEPERRQDVGAQGWRRGVQRLEKAENLK
jgi:hypothetical protein